MKNDIQYFTLIVKNCQKHSIFVWNSTSMPLQSLTQHADDCTIVHAFCDYLSQFHQRILLRVVKAKIKLLIKITDFEYIQINKYLLRNMKLNVKFLDDSLSSIIIESSNRMSLNNCQPFSSHLANFANKSDIVILTGMEKSLTKRGHRRSDQIFLQRCLMRNMISLYITAEDSEYLSLKGRHFSLEEYRHYN